MSGRTIGQSGTTANRLLEDRMRHDIREHGRIILAFGEVTGHCHEILTAEADVPTLDQAQFYELDGVRELLILAPCLLRHEEHAPIALFPNRQEQYRQGDVLLCPTGPGTWRVTTQREWAGPDEWRAVLD